MDNDSVESDRRRELLRRVESAVPDIPALDAAREQVLAADLPHDERCELLDRLLETVTAVGRP